MNTEGARVCICRSDVDATVWGQSILKNLAFLCAHGRISNKVVAYVERERGNRQRLRRIYI